MIKRREKYITPNFSSEIEANNTLIVVSETQEGINNVYQSLRILELAS